MIGFSFIFIPVRFIADYIAFFLTLTRLHGCYCRYFILDAVDVDVVVVVVIGIILIVYAACHYTLKLSWLESLLK